MGLTTGRGPLSFDPAGRFIPPIPEDVVYVEPLRRRVRGVANGEAVVDSERVLLVHEPDEPPAYAFPFEDVDLDLLVEVNREGAREGAFGGFVQPEPLSEVPGYVQVAWDAVDAWYEEDEEVIYHPRNPYHRVECVRTSRRLRVEVGGVVLVDTTDTLGVYETGLEPRLYVRPEAVRRDLLVAGSERTFCSYKGTAWYWTAVVCDLVVENVAWSYEDPLPESLLLRGLLSFDEARASVIHDLPSGADLATLPPPSSELHRG